MIELQALGRSNLHIGNLSCPIDFEKMAHKMFTATIPLEEEASPEIIVTNPTKFKAKIERFIRDGASNLEVVSDFDQTFTRYSVGSKKVHSTYSALQSALTPEQIEECTNLYRHYHPLETNSALSFHEKFVLMETWQSESSNAMLKVPFSEADLKKVCEADNLLLRDGVKSFLELCKEEGVPVTIVSAGIGNLINLCLEQLEGGFNVEVFSNVVEFDDLGMSSSFHKPLIHSLSKPAILAEKTLKKHVLLLGDMPHDLLMVGHHSQEDVLSIGFFNDANRYNIADYQDKYDVLCMFDGTFEVVELIASWICGVQHNLKESPITLSLAAYSEAEDRALFCCEVLPRSQETEVAEN